MKTDKVKNVNDASTEEKIKNAARSVFHKKGFAASRTRDIADEAGINLALLNYYFRSKEKLFNIVMLETFKKFFASITAVFNETDSTFEEKIAKFASGYIDLLFQEPEIPLFILSEIRNHPEELIREVGIKETIFTSVFIQQYNSGVESGQIREQNFLHLMMNFMALIIFPFIAKPLFKEIGGLSDEQFNNIISERKKLIPVWIESIIKN